MMRAHVLIGTTVACIAPLNGASSYCILSSLPKSLSSTRKVSSVCVAASYVRTAHSISAPLALLTPALAA